MAKVILEFNLPDDEADMLIAVQANDYREALFCVSNDIFRPGRKHGYANQTIQNLIDKDSDTCLELISELENLFVEILNRKGLSI